MTNLSSLLNRLRKRVHEFREANSGEYISIHILSIEIAICLTEFSLKTSPARKITKEEEKWFNAGFQIDLILSNSEWADISELYYSIVKEVKEKDFFR